MDLDETKGELNLRTSHLYVGVLDKNMDQNPSRKAIIRSCSRGSGAPLKDPPLKDPPLKAAVASGGGGVSNLLRPAWG